MSKKIIIIQHRSAGNESVGDMWHESFEFDESVSLKEVIDRVRQNSIAENYWGGDIIIPRQSKETQ